MAERTGCPVLSNLWSYVHTFRLFLYIYCLKNVKAAKSGTGFDYACKPL